MAQKVLLLLALVLGGLILYSNNINFFNSSSKKYVGDVWVPVGIALGRSDQSQSFTNLKNNQKIPKFFEIVTGNDGGAKIKFGETFSVGANSHLVLSKKTQLFSVKLLRGSIHRKRAQKNTVFYIGDQKQTELELEHKAFEKWARIQETTTFNSSGETVIEKKDPQFQILLEKTMTGHQRFLERCFIKLYESSSGQITGGRILVRFMLNKKGRMDKVSIKESRFEDQKFNECIEEVISRVRFKRYEGKERTVDLPIEIQLPQTI